MEEFKEFSVFVDYVSKEVKDKHFDEVLIASIPLMEVNLLSGFIRSTINEGIKQSPHAALISDFIVGSMLHSVNVRMTDVESINPLVDSQLIKIAVAIKGGGPESSTFIELMTQLYMLVVSTDNRNVSITQAQGEIETSDVADPISITSDDSETTPEGLAEESTS